MRTERIIRFILNIIFVFFSLSFIIGAVTFFIANPWLRGVGVFVGIIFIFSILVILNIFKEKGVPLSKTTFATFSLGSSAGVLSGLVIFYVVVLFFLIFSGEELSATSLLAILMPIGLFLVLIFILVSATKYRLSAHLKKRVVSRETMGPIEQFIPWFILGVVISFEIFFGIRCFNALETYEQNTKCIPSEFIFIAVIGLILWAGTLYLVRRK